MTQADERELHRLADMLRDIDSRLDRESGLREGLKKAGYALSVAFMHNLRPEIERHCNLVRKPLTDAERAKLTGMGIILDE